MSDPLKLVGDHLQKNPRRKSGVPGSGLVPCQISPHHGHHPADELCPDCDHSASPLEDWLGDYYGYEYTDDGVLSC